MFSSSAWMNDNDALLLSIIQGPAAAGSHISGWAQYLRRITTYGCMVFGVCNNNVVTDADAAKISEKDWLRWLQSFSENVWVDPYGMLLVDCRIADDARQERQGGSTFVRHGGNRQEDLQSTRL